MLLIRFGRLLLNKYRYGVNAWGFLLLSNKWVLILASVAFDTLQSAKANGADVVIIDTAGRLHNKVGLMMS